MPRISPAPDIGPLFEKSPPALGAVFQNPEFGRVRDDAVHNYRHWHRFRFIARQAGLDPEAAWAVIKLSRDADRTYLPFESSEGIHLSYCTTGRVQRELMMTDRDLAGRLSTDTDTGVPDDLSDRYIVSSLMEEAIASSQLEGASTVHRVAKEMLRRNREPRDLHERMILNNYRAITWMRDHKHEKLTPDSLLELQRMLTEGTLDRPDESGRFRAASEEVVVADPYDNVLHTPPHADSLPLRLRTLCDFANEDYRSAEPFVHPFVRGATLHFQLAYDHPFCDGNGRTARVLFYWMMLRSGYWMFEYLPLSRLILKGPGKYQRAFQYVETDAFDLTYFLVYTARLVERARSELATYLRRKEQERRAARRTYANESLNDRQRLFLSEIGDQTDHEYSIEVYQTTFGIAYATARSDLLKLEELGFLDRKKIGKKFVFTPRPGKIG